MAHRPHTVVFVNVVETLISMEPLRRRSVETGMPSSTLSTGSSTKVVVNVSGRADVTNTVDTLRAAYDYALSRVGGSADVASRRARLR